MSYEENYIDLEKESSLFFDTYAIYEILNENKNYLPYANTHIVTTKLNIFELFYTLLRDGKEELAKSSFEEYYQYIVDFDENVIKEAAQLKLKMNKRDVSMTDCIGYTLAKKLGLKFLTGDRAFKDMDNVEFVI